MLFDPFRPCSSWYFLNHSLNICFKKPKRELGLKTGKVCISDRTSQIPRPLGVTRIPSWGYCWAPCPGRGADLQKDTGTASDTHHRTVRMHNINQGEEISIFLTGCQTDWIKTDWKLLDDARGARLTAITTKTELSPQQFPLHCFIFFVEYTRQHKSVCWLFKAHPPPA